MNFRRIVLLAPLCALGMAIAPINGSLKDVTDAYVCSLFGEKEEFIFKK